MPKSSFLDGKHPSETFLALFVFHAWLVNTLTAKAYFERGQKWPRKKELQLEIKALSDQLRISELMLI